jgi:PadR family transcriptional regulator PadR
MLCGNRSPEQDRTKPCFRLFRRSLRQWCKTARESRHETETWRDVMADSKLDLLQGTLDLMVLQTLDVLSPLHGYGIARRIEQLSDNEILLNQGTIYASLVRLQQRAWIRAEWGVSETNRKAKFYAITKAGKRQMQENRSQWERLAAVMGRVLAAERSK